MNDILYVMENEKHQGVASGIFQGYSNQWFDAMFSYFGFVVYGIGERSSIAAGISSSLVPSIKKYSRHHWSYANEHMADIIYVRDHFEVHHLLDGRVGTCFSGGGVLLDTKEKHMDFLEDRGFEIIRVPFIGVPGFNIIELIKEWNVRYPNKKSLSSRFWKHIKLFGLIERDYGFSMSNILISNNASFKKMYDKYIAHKEISAKHFNTEMLNPRRHKKEKRGKK